MSILLQASSAFYDVCAFLARGVQIGTDTANYVIQLNYNVVVTVYTTIYSTVSTIAAGALQVWGVLCGITAYLFDFVCELLNFSSSIVHFVWKLLVGAFSFLDWSYVKVVHFLTFCTHSISQTYLNMRQTVVDACDSVSYVIFSVADIATTIVTSVFLFLTSIGSSSVNFVTGVWHGLGYVLSSVAYFPFYCIECVESAKERLTNFVIHAVTLTPKETYLGIVCLCLVYFTFSNTFRYLSCRGLPLFSSRQRSRRRGQGLDWHFDRGFESDFEDLYSSDTEEREWTINPTSAADSDDSEDYNESEDGNNDDDSNDSGTVDNDLSDDDEDSEDENTIVSDESDSDASLNSQTFSTESSDHEIDIQLPSSDERYNLRTRSSTPSRYPNALNSPEEFDREMEKERDKRKCVVCQDQMKSVLVLPCRHMCMCIDCADHIVRSRFVGRRVCPLCRTRIQKVMDVYV